MKKDKKGIYTHKIYSYYGNDFQGKVTLDRFINILLDSAGSHAEDNGFGKQFISNEGCTWVLSRLNVVLHSFPKDYQELYVSTWVRDIKSAFSMRVFEVKDAEGTTVVSATSLWSVINLKSRRLVPIQNIISREEMVCTDDVKAKIPKKMIFERGEEVAKTEAQYTDLDFNCHVNSNRYIQWALNSYDLDFWKKNYLKQLEIAFNHEVYYGDMVSIYKNNRGEVSDIEIFNKSQDQTACKVRLHFGLQ